MTTRSSWYFPNGALAAPNKPLALDATTAGWTYCGIDVHAFSKSMTSVETDLGDREAVVVPLSSLEVEVRFDSKKYRLQGRPGVFAAIADWFYAPVGAKFTVSAESGEVAVCTAIASKEFPAHHGGAASVPVEPRGAGFATRQVNNIATPDSFQSADRIIICEVLTPGGNWSSWPPHRHDGVAGCPNMNEEIYYFRIGKQNSDHGDSEGRGYFHAYTVDNKVDDTLTIRDGDVYILPAGYHGPTIAAPEYPMYFLNVLAGPAPQRTMAFCDDPSHHWIRDSWKTQSQDPRVPMTSSTGRVHHK
ncbi:MAG: 5-deoxy-glucuronate isomerase [Actinobacteria bacterium]|nr:5-deoxy-glucuronate isomerase [Actinomycetota bacterium]